MDNTIPRDRKDLNEGIDIALSRHAAMASSCRIHIFAKMTPHGERGLDPPDSSPRAWGSALRSERSRN